MADGKLWKVFLYSLEKPATEFQYSIIFLQLGKLSCQSIFMDLNVDFNLFSV